MKHTIKILEKMQELSKIPCIKKNLDKIRENDPTLEKGMTYLYKLAESALAVNEFSHNAKKRIMA